MSTRANRPGGTIVPFAAFALLFAARVPGAAAAGAAAKSTAGPAAAATANGRASQPTEESMSERRAVRGVAVDGGGESPELSELRRFEAQAFPRDGAAPEPSDDGDAVAEPPPGLPGKWEGSGDVPEAFRSPDATNAPARSTPAPDSDWLRTLALPELPVRWDPQVLRYLDYFKSDPRGRAVMTNWLRRSGRYRSLIEAALVRESLPKDLFYVAMVESGFDTGARSRVGAGGIWQFMPGAARAYGLEVSYWIDARRDPERAVEAAARYLKDLYVRFGSWHLVFAAYTAGYGAILKSITRYNTNDYWELCRHEAGLPWESSLYVPKILAAAIVGHNLQAFGFADVVPDPPFAYERVEVPAGTGLATVARATKTRPELLTALNPAVIRDRTPPDRATFTVRIPVGTGAMFAEAFDKARSSAGERLEAVTLRAGVAILVPKKKGVGAARDEAGAVVKGDGATATAAKADDDEPEVLVAVPDRVFNYEGRERVFYRTRDGDTLDDVAEAFGVRPDDLVEWNNLDPSARIHPKMVLQLFVRTDFDPTNVVLLDPASVRVVTLGSQEFLELEAARRGKKRLVIEAKSSDTLTKIGRRYGLTVGDLARINRFSYSTELHDGQKVVVYSPVGGVSREVAQGLTPEPRHDRGVLAMPRSGAKAAPAATAAAIAKAGGARPPVAAKGGDKLIAARDRGKDKDRDKAADRPAEKSPPRAVSRTAASSKPAPKKK